MIDIHGLARTPHLLVCCDYDGTLSPITDTPQKAQPLSSSVTALRALSLLPATTVAVISGRSLRDLAALSRLPAEIHLVGSHGSEFDLDFVHALDMAQVSLLHELVRDCSVLVSGVEGAQIETKPASVAVHVRRCSPQDAASLLQAVETGPGARAGVHVRHGKAVIEIGVVDSNKAEAVHLLRHRTGASAVLFMGDDVTDESVFPELLGPDVGIKVGPGPTTAGERLDGPEAVAALLADLADERQRWLLGGHAAPIEDHVLLSDGRAAGLVSPSGSIDWLCAPEPDSPAFFAALLGDPSSGHFSITPCHGERPLAQAYVSGTMTVRTRWAGLTLLDYLDTHVAGEHGASAPVRLVRHVSGSERAVVSFAPRPQFGMVRAGIEVHPEGLRVTGASDAAVLYAPGIDWHVRDEGGHQVASAIIDPTHGDVILELRYGTNDLTADVDGEPMRRHRSEALWRDWLAGIVLPGARPDAEARSALTLKALCHVPTGAILAAVTTSLPEGIGGVRNWDYRYCWIRDAALTARALVDLGSLHEAEAYLSWLLVVVATATDPERLHPLYTLRGTVLGSEAVIDSLPGYAGSRPVRVGNAAQGQVQLDVFGPIVALIDDVTSSRGSVHDEEWWLTRACVEAVAARWQEPDHGIWEVRDRPRHHVHSRMMCWLAVDRAIAVAQRRGEATPGWQELRDRIIDDIEEHGWDETLSCYVAAYDRIEPDAAVLQGLLEGYPAPTERVAGTVLAVEHHLRRSSGVFRYRYDDGLPGPEGAMHICAAWLAVAYVRLGQVEDALQLLDSMLDSAGDAGLLPEQVDPASRRGLGNHPQAYSHIGVLAVTGELVRRR